MSHQELLGIAKSVAALIPRLARGMSPSHNDPAEELPLAQLRVCGILADGPRPMSTLSRELGVSLSALTQIADRLERVRLVKRIAEGSDRRVRCLQLTSRGEKMMRQRGEARDQRVMAVLRNLSPSQREMVQSSLELLVAASTVVANQPDVVNGEANGQSESGQVDVGVDRDTVFIGSDEIRKSRVIA